jgi:flagellar biosynthesis/type III secretory pathway M-ring protein FliF/YscJ
VPHPDDAASFDVFSMEKKREAHLQLKILDALAYIPAVRVSVSVEVDTSKRVTQKLKHDAAQPKIETSQSSESGAAGSGAEPGVQANLGQSISAGSNGGMNTTEETMVENFEPKLSETETVEQIPFAIKSATATVGIPRSFVVGLYQAQFPKADKPEDDNPDFSKLRDDLLNRVKRGIERIVMAKKPNDVEVSIYPDMEWSVDGGSWSRAPAAGMVTQASSESFDALGLVKGYGPQIGLGFLALLSLFTMTRIVRSAPPVPKPAGVAEKKAGSAAEEAEPLLAAGASAVGKASLSESLLVGREVDDDTLRYQELGEEVAKLVEADPESAAELIRRWMDES